MGNVRFENDHVAAILGFGDLQWGNILITRVYFVEGLGHNLFSVGQFCDSNLEVAFRKNACFVRNLEGVDLLKGDRSTNLRTINLHEMASTSPICLMARASSTKSWLWHQRLSHLNFDTINDLARNDLIIRNIFVFHVSKEKQKSISSTQTCSKFKEEVTSSSYGFMWTNENCQYKWKALCFGDCGRLLLLHVETMNVSFDELSAMAFEQRSSKPRLQSELDLLFEAMYNDYNCGQPSATARTIPAAQEPQVRQTSTTSTSIEDTAPTPTNSSSQATTLPNTSQDVDELNPHQQQVQQQGSQAHLQSSTVADNVLNALFDGNTFVNPFAIPSTSATESSSSHNVDPSNMHTFYQPYTYEF
nr:integrase, catalytic region, zinc finger, CCHC-type, peptidase aspartic, catalytic [Tanacetum cinerariifolium]